MIAARIISAACLLAVVAVLCAAPIVARDLATLRKRDADERPEKTEKTVKR